MFDAEEIISQLLEADGPLEMSFETGESTTLMPAHYVPMPDGEECRVSLNGTWRVARWPFAAGEAALASPNTGGSGRVETWRGGGRVGE